MSTFYDLSVVEEINVKLLKPSSAPLRSGVGSLDDLMESIRQHGLLEPLIVRPHLEGFEVVAGNRRFAACRQLRWQKVACIVRDITDREAFELSLTENVQRESLNPIDEAEAFQRYVFDNGWGSMGELARRLGKSPGYVSQRVSLLRLPKRIRALIASGKIGVSSAREVTRAEHTQQMYLLASLVSKGGASSREIRGYVRTLTEESWQEEGEKSIDRDLKTLRKSILVLRVAMARVTSMIERSEDISTEEYLLSVRSLLHEMIDRTIRLSLKRKTMLRSRDA